MHGRGNATRWLQTAGPLLLALVCAPGCTVDVNTEIRTAPKWIEITPRHRMTPPPAAPARNKPVATRRRDRPQKSAIVAVFDIEDRGVGLSKDLLSQMSDYLVMSLAAAGAYQVVPRDQLRQRLQLQKQDSFRQCYDQSCQIEIGRELAAQKTLNSVIMKLGSKCMMTAVLYDLKRATSEGGARTEGGCSEDGIVGQIKSIVRQLAR